MSSGGPSEHSSPPTLFLQCRQVQAYHCRTRDPRCTAPGGGDRLPGADVGGAVQGPGGSPRAWAGQPGEPGPGRALPAGPQGGKLPRGPSQPFCLAPKCFGTQSSSSRMPALDTFSAFKAGGGEKAQSSKNTRPTQSCACSGLEAGSVPTALSTAGREEGEKEVNVHGQIVLKSVWEGPWTEDESPEGCGLCLSLPRPPPLPPLPSPLSCAPRL